MRHRRHSTPIRPTMVATAVVVIVLATLGSFHAQTQGEVYDEATQALDRKQYERALDLYRQAERMRGNRSDASAYWQAWIHYKLAQSDHALRKLEQLSEQHPDSRWQDDADDLRAEITGGVSADDEMKLFVLQSLVHSDPDRALPHLEKIIEGDNPKALKEQALFLLAQSGNPRGTEIVAKLARDSSDRELQQAAVVQLGIIGDARSQQLLSDLYDGTGDRELKLQILQGFMMGGNTERLLVTAQDDADPEIRANAVQMLGMSGATTELERLYEGESSAQVKEAILSAFMMVGDTQRVLQAATGESSEALRETAIQLLGMMGATEELWRLYGKEESVAVRRNMLQALAITGETDRLIEVARTDPSPELRLEAIQGLGFSGGLASAAALKQFYAGESDRDVRHTVIQALGMRGEVQELIRIARTEEDTELKRAAVRHLAMADSAEAREYLLELLGE